MTLPEMYVSGQLKWTTLFMLVMVVYTTNMASTSQHLTAMASLHLFDSGVGSRSALYIDVPEPEDGPTYASTTEIQDDLGNKIVIPGGFHLDKDSGKYVEDGIVIEDGNGNQFVWIPAGTYQTSSGSKTNNLSRRRWADRDIVAEPTEVSEGDTVYGDVRRFLWRRRF